MKRLIEVGEITNDVLFFKQYVPKFIARYNPRWQEIESLPHEYIFDGIKVETREIISLPKNSSHWMACLQMRSIIRSKIRQNNYNIIHAHFAYPYGLAAALAGKDCGVPVVITCHGSDINTLPKRTIDAQIGVRLALTTSDKVITVSRALSESVKSIVSRSVEVIYNGVDPSVVNVEKLERIIYVGNLIKTKGIRDLITAFKKSNATNLVLVGDGEEREFIETQAKLLPAGKSIVLLGKLENMVVRKEIAMSQILILPSYSEGLPTVIMEAMMEGVPVVSTNVGGIPEIAHHNQNALLVGVGNSDELAMAINRLLEDIELREEFSDRSLRYAERNLNSVEAAKSILNIYRSLLK
ncbi:glycosyl transferase [Deinococcus aerius]|uniref:Glycosyl transferase n=1 Tax=Deinococcus aerius TaxID=200253 RepID=A0A2I9DK10_9DEIO|nr:glycosyltransferase [Deinococcus aerius]GBF06708.1 glycosyl transferase [Deinococcus aerius]